MVKDKKKQKSPSRVRYENSNPTMSVRLPKQQKERLLNHIAASGQSPAVFLRGIADNEDALAEERVDALVKKKYGLLKERLRYINDLLINGLAFFCIENGLPAPCPRCGDKGNARLFLAWGYELRADGEREEVPSWKCPMCGWYIDAYGAIDPKSLRWHDTGEVQSYVKLQKDALNDRSG